MKPSILSINNYHYLRGGTERYWFALNQLFKEKGHYLHLLSTSDPNNIESEVSGTYLSSVNIHQARIGNLIRFLYSKEAAKAIRVIVKKKRPDVAHLHIYYGQITSSILRPLQRDGIPIVQTLHDYKLACPVSTLYSRDVNCEACEGQQYWHGILKRCNRNQWTRSIVSVLESYLAKWMGSIQYVSHFITVSEYQRSKLTKLGIPGEKMTTIHNFMDVDGVSTESRAGQYFLYFGRIEHTKGLMTLLKAVAPLKEYPLLIAGEGSALPDVQKYVDQNQLTHIRLIGFKQGRELDDLIRGSICTVLPSVWYETFGMSVLESYSRCRPVIASNIGGIPEVVSHGQDGFLIPAGDVEALRERMIWMNEHRREAVEMGNYGRMKVETEFNPEVHYDKIMSVYRKVL